ncbi:MAG: hypothetical protein AB8B91_11690 [Rubripirellula sp.]
MSVEVQQWMLRLNEEVEATSRAITDLQVENADAPQVLQALVRQRTDAFIDLAKHYLPDLTRRTINRSWREVRGRIRDLFLQQNDTSRGLHSQLEHVSQQCDELRAEVVQVQTQFDRARLDLASKTGNFKRELASNPQLIQCVEEIDQIDREIEHGLAQLEKMQSDANVKLPDYEACSLFCYLRDQKFGTPEYAGNRLERHWDAWVAQLIDFKNAKTSFDYLSQTPVFLRELIEEKSRRYHSLLKQLDQTREQARSQFGIDTQETFCRQLEDKLANSDQAWRGLQAERDCLQKEVDRVESIDSEHYQRAIDVYRQFLAELDEDTLRVYSECTASPVDDEICARLRKIDSEIAVVESQTSERNRRLVKLEFQRNGLRELAERITDRLQEGSITLSLDPAFRFEEQLSLLRDERIGPHDVWQNLLTAMPAWRLPASGLRDAHMDPVEASFVAAAETDSIGEPDGRRLDESGIALLPPLEKASESGKFGFATLAMCRTEADANDATAILRATGVRCFVHVPVTSLADSKSIRLMVAPNQFTLAREWLLDRQSGKQNG